MTRRRTAAALAAVLGLTGALVFAGSLAATAQPDGVTMDTASGNVVGPFPPITGTMDWSNAVGGSVYVTVTNSAGATDFCTGSSYTAADTLWSCPITLEYGSNTVTATAVESDDLGNPLSTASIVLVQGGTQPVTITSPPAAASITGLSFAVAGDGPQMGNVSVQARALGDPPASAVTLCTTTVSAAGTWTCPTTFPDYRHYTLSAIGTTLTGVGVIGAADQDLNVAPHKPTAVVTSTPDGGLESTTTANAADQVAAARWTFWPAATGGPQTSLDSCPAGWTYSPPPAGTQTIDCDITPGAPGTYLLHGNGFRNDTYSSDFAYLGRIPASPVIAAVTPAVGGGADVVGTVDTAWVDPYGGVNSSGLLVTVVIDGYGVVCTATPDGAGNWSCDDAPAPGGDQDLHAYTSTVGFGGGSLDGYWDGSSAYGNTVSATLFDTEVQITSPANGSTPAYAPDPIVVTGTSTLAAPVSVTINGDAVGTCTNIPVVGGDWSCTISSIGRPPGEYTLIASQAGSADHEVTFTRILPAPDINGLPLTFPEGTGVVSVGGQNNYAAAGTTVSVYPGPSCNSAEGGTSGTWSCDLDLTGLGAGTYWFDAQNYLSSDPSLTSAVTSVTVTIEPSPSSAPTLNCTFAPGGGFSATSPQQLEAFSIYRIVEIEYSKGGSVLGEQGYCNGSSGTTFPEWTEFSYDLVADCDAECDPASISVSSLPPGDYEVFHRVSDGSEAQGVSYGSHSYVFTIPEAPTIGNESSTTNSVTLSGTATAGDAIRVVRANGTDLCSTTATGGGTWSCSFAKSAVSTARAIAIDPSSGGMSAYSASRAIPVTVEPPAPDPEIPTLTLWFLQFGGNFTDLIPGQTFTVSVSGMPTGTEIEVWMHSTPQLIGTALGTGAPMELEFTVPADIEPGEHMIEVIAVTPEGEVFTSTSDATVLAVKPSDGADKAAPDEDAAGEESGGAGSAGAGDRSNPAAPSGLTDSIAPLAQIIDNPVTIAIAGGLALALLFLVALPTELLNSSLSSNSSRLGRVYGTIDRAMTTAQDWLIRVTRSRAVAAGVLVVVVAIIYGFVDPGFGLDVVSLRLVLALAIALFVLSFVASWISGVIIRRAWGAIGVVAMQPTIILFAVIGVIVARILEFSPGFLVGVAIGLELLQASKQVTARAVFVQIGVVTGLALAAWVVYSLFTPGDDFVGMLIDDTMVAITAEGLTGALIAVFPLKFLDGRDLWEVSKRLWAAAFLLVAVAFALLVLPTAVQGTDVADYGVWLLVFAAFGLASFAVWLIFVRADKRAATAAEKRKVDA